MEKLSAILDEGEADIGAVEATETEGAFYLTSRPEVALAYSLSDVALVPTHLTVGEKPKGNFIQMADSL